MDKEFRYLPSHILIYIILGIITQIKFSLWNFGFIKLYSLLIFLFIIAFILHRLFYKRLFIIITSFCYIFIGISATYISSSKNYNNHYRKVLDSNSLFTIKITEELKSNTYNRRFIGKVLKVNQKKTIGKVILNLNKSKDTTKLVIGSLIIAKSQLQEIQPPKNPYGFNYKNYLSIRGIEDQLFLNNKEYKISPNSTLNFHSKIFKFRQKIQQKLKSAFPKDVYSIINSLLLGERKGVSKELITSYANAGAIHILAISGLHIGILVIILNSIFSPLLILKHGKSIRLLILISSLWVFALFTGLSASVVRAVTMFSFMIIGNTLKQKQPVEHSLISSMLILLLVKPQFIFDVGFQLSYLAVFSIIKLQPLLLKIWAPNNFLLNKFWQLTTVSLAAQIGVLPLSLYYFHQFPSLFIISNLIIIPWLGIILALGIIIIILALIELLPQFIIKVYEFIIQFMNSIVTWVSNQEQFIFGNIFLSALEMLFWYSLLILFFGIVSNRSVKRVLIFLITIITFQSYLINSNYINHNKKELVIFHKNKTSILGIRDQGIMKVYSHLQKDQLVKEQIISNYTTYENLSIKKDTSNTRITYIPNQLILCIDSLGVYPKNFSKQSIILLKHSPKLNLNRLITTLQPKIIVADGSNYKSYINRWKETCKQQKTPFHSTQQNGAYILKY